MDCLNKLRGLLSRTLLSSALLMAVAAGAQAGPVFERIPTQFIAALASPTATSGTGAESWGLWRVDPGPRGVRLRNHDDLVAAGGVAPAGWKFDNADWWLEENGLIMEPPEYALQPGQYLVTGGREAVAVLTVHEKDASGAQRWELGSGATIHDVTHLKCRSARYRPAAGSGMCTPANAPRNEFPVTPGADMPPIQSCSKQDYWVLFVIGRASAE